MASSATATATVTTTTTTANSSKSDTSWEPYRLTHLKPSFDSHEMALASRKDLWHKFIIYNGALHGRTDVLRAVITACEPEILIPVMYTIEDKNKSTFLAKCSNNTIENMVKQSLCITLPGGQELRMDIVLGFLGTQALQLNTNRIIVQALHDRYEPMKKVFNLDDFENEKALGSIFCPISIPKILHFVLCCSKAGIMGGNRESKLPVRELSLKYNKITAIILFDKFFNYHLTKLDLRHNQILDVEYLRYFCEFKIIELWLDGNPLCAKYSNSQDYIQAVKNIFPHLQKLDGIVIGMEKKFVPSIQSNYLGNGTKISLIKQFVRHFFTLYDQDDRIVMNGLYDKNAFYSMTTGATQMSYVHKEIIKTFSTNRNLLKFVDYAKCHEFLFFGPEKIITALQRQPSTTHNFKTFHLDLLHEGDNYIAISVQGLFMYRTLFCPPMLFNRTFIILRKEDNEYCIANDQYYIDGPPASVISEAKFEYKSAPKFVPTMLSVSEKEQLLRFLRELTTMNIRYCYKYLQDAEWDVRNAITKFMKNYAVNDISPEAFQ